MRLTSPGGNAKASTSHRLPVSRSHRHLTALVSAAFDEQVAEAIAIPDAQCPKRLIASTHAMEALFASGEGDKIKKLYNAENLIGTWIAYSCRLPRSLVLDF